MIHQRIKSIEAFVEKPCLYAGTEGFDEFEPCKIIALSSYKDSLLTAQILLENGAIFSDVPLHVLYTSKVSCSAHQEINYTYSKNVASEHFIAYQLFDRGQPCRFKVKRNGKILCEVSGAKYLLTVDWYRDNEQMHLVEDTNGRLYLVNQPHILFTNKADKWPNYLKARAQWNEDILKD